MRQVKRQRQLRRLILAGTGLAGALFGLMGAVILSESITQLVLQSTDTANLQPVGLTIVIVLMFVTWLLGDELNPG
jgi:hypothetical protein